MNKFLFVSFCFLFSLSIQATQNEQLLSAQEEKAMILRKVAMLEKTVLGVARLTSNQEYLIYPMDLLLMALKSFSLEELRVLENLKETEKTSFLLMLLYAYKKSSVAKL